MKKNLILFAAASAAMLACSKNVISEEVAEVVSTPVEMTLTATIGTDTKVSYKDEDNVIKVAWEVGDKVSLLALDENGSLLSNDVFTAVTAGKSATFSGVFHDSQAIDAVWVYYPALTEGSGTHEDSYMYPIENGYSDDGVLYGGQIGSQDLYVRPFYHLQNAFDNPAHLKNYTLMAGVADLGLLGQGSLSASLEHLSYVLKVDVTLPQQNMTVNYMTIYPYLSNGQSRLVSGSGGFAINDPEYYFSSQSYNYYLAFGNSVTGGVGTGLQVDGNSFTAYLIAYAGMARNYYVNSHEWTTFQSTDRMDVLVNTTLGGITASHNLGRYVKLENGNMYCLMIDLSGK